MPQPIDVRPYLDPSRYVTAEDIQALQDMLAQLPVPLWVLMGLAGLLLLGWGARLYKLSLQIVAFGGGAAFFGWLTLLMQSQAGPEASRPVVVVALALCGGLVSMIVAWRVQIMTLTMVGMVAGAVAGSMVAAHLSEVPMLYLMVGGGAFGGVGLPLAWTYLLRFATSVLGAWLLASAMGHPDNLLAIGGLAVVGTLVQFRTKKRKKKKKKAQEEDDDE